MARPNTRELILMASRVFTGVGDTLVEDGFVAVRDEKIHRVGRQSEIDELNWPHDVDRRNYGDATIMPGLVDAHTHLTLPADRQPYEAMARNSDEMMALIAIRNALIHLGSGVTTLRDNGGRNSVTFTVREALRRGYYTGPRLLLSGRPLTHSKGHFFWCNGVADGPVEIRQRVRELVAEGADHIKIMASGGGTKGTERHYASYTADEMRVAVETAHGLGRLTTAHCHAKQSMINALDAGLDCMEHGEFNVPAPSALIPSGIRNGDLRTSGLFHEESMSYEPAITHRIAESGMFLSFTMQAGGFERLLDLRGKPPSDLSAEEAQFRNLVERKFEKKQEIFSRLMDDGLANQMPISSDAGCYDGSFGRLDLGLGLAIDAGMTNVQALRAVTSVAAAACGVSQEVGTLEAGKFADVLVVDGDPTKDIAALRSVAAVYLDGKLAAPGAIPTQNS